MKKITCLAVAAVFLCIIMILPPPAGAMDDPGFTIGRMVTCTKIVNREPSGVTDSFPAETRRAFCFLEAVDIEHDTEITFVWYYHNSEMARVVLPLKKGRRWRTRSNKRVAGMRGPWRVELQDAAGIVQNTLNFWVE